MNMIKNLWSEYSNWLAKLTAGEKALLVLALLILGSIWLIFDVTPMHK